MLSPSIMGVVNVTPDSFYGATRTPDATDAINRGIALFNEGADIVDVGGESTRPGAVDVDVVEELARISPVVEALAAYGPVSIDTRKAQVARAAVALGASVINDVGGSLAEVAGELKVGYVAMHAQGTPQTMQINPHYDDVLAEVLDGLATLAQRAQRAGVAQLWLDPGIGFGKRLEDNWTLLRHTSDVVGLASSLGAGVLIGTSRKRFLASTGVEPLEVDDRFEGSLATATWALAQGASMVRVHDVVALAQVRELLVRPVAEVGS
jgi:dihydropteroate synthase